MEQGGSTKYISQSANNFVRDLYKLEHLEGQEARREFNNLMQSYEQMFIDKYSEMNQDTDLIRQIREMEHPQNNQNDPLAMTSFIPDGRMDGTYQKMNINSFTPNQTYYKPPMDQNAQFGAAQAQPHSLGMRQPTYNIHANTKHYFPKESEYLTGDNFVNKPGNSFGVNRNAVLMKDTPKEPEQTDPYLAKLRDNFGATAPMSFGVQNTGIENANNQPVSGHHNFMFNPQFGNNDMQNNQQLMDNIQRLGGLSPTLNLMEQSLTENEMRFMARNSLNANPQNFNDTLNTPYQHQQGIVGMNVSRDPFNLLRTQEQQFRPNQGPQTPNRIHEVGGLMAGFAMGRQETSHMVPHRYQGSNDPYQQPPTSKIELSRMMRGEREDELILRAQQNQKFENFNKMLKNTAANNIGRDDYSKP